MTSINLYAKKIDGLKISGNKRFLIQKNGGKFFPIADTAWKIAWKLNRDDVEKYLDTRKKQKFNTIALVAFPMDVNLDKIYTNIFGDLPFEVKNAKYNSLKPIVTPGKNYKNSDQYDYWDNLEFIIDAANDKGLYVVILPCWGGCVAGAYGCGKKNQELIFNDDKAFKYAEWIANRFKNKSNLIWMLGGDRSAVYGKNDYRNVFRAMAKGITKAYDKKPVLISYHPQKWAPNSSKWFHNDNWLSFNSIQDQPSDQINSIDLDYNFTPAKPTWLFEGGYEKRGQGKNIYTDWQVRFQSYQTVFAGGFGVTYGHMDIWHFSNKSPELDEKNIANKENTEWAKGMNDPGANQMQFLFDLMTTMSDKQFLDRIPDQNLIDGDSGKMTGHEGCFSCVIQATRAKNGDYAMIYSANGRNIRINMNRLDLKKKNAYWFNPRNGKWNVNGKEFTKPKPFLKNISSGKNALVHEFNPPGNITNGNDWVLLLKNN